jgi:division protein CdvB (Snf7/Vps24/ESCRT-III family)
MSPDYFERQRSQYYAQLVHEIEVIKKQLEILAKVPEQSFLIADQIRESLHKIMNAGGMLDYNAKEATKKLKDAEAPYTPEVKEAIALLFETFKRDDDD